MPERKALLLRATACAALLHAATPWMAEAADVEPGGKLDVTIAGFARFYWGAGDIEARTAAPSGGNSDFRNDTEVHFKAVGKDESTGIDYGATIEFEADTNRTDNTDETYVWLRGAFGRWELGDNDGVAKDYSYMAQTVAVATGGLDGEIVQSTNLIYLDASGSDNTKIKYESPSIGGFQLALSYMPHLGSAGDDFPASTDDGNIDDVLSGAMRYSGSFGGLDVAASLAGEHGHLNAGGDDEYFGIVPSAKIGILGFRMAGGLGMQERGNVDRNFYTIGAAYSFRAFSVSLNWGDCFDCDDRENSDLVLGAEVGLLPGLSLGYEIAFFNEDRGGDDDGVVGVASLRMAF